MEILFASNVKKELERLKNKQPKLADKVQAQIKVFIENPKHPSLRLHKLKGRLNNSWSISITGGYRLLYYVQDNKVVFYDLGTHDQVYK